eukprot:6487251-Amphidinium_carterae.2
MSVKAVRLQVNSATQVTVGKVEGSNSEKVWNKPGKKGKLKKDTIIDKDISANSALIKCLTPRDPALTLQMLLPVEVRAMT